MNQDEFVDSLDKKRQHKLALELLEKTLPIWNEYAESHKLEYTDTVVGMHHVVEKDIISRTLQTVRDELANPKSQRERIRQLILEFRDPIVAIQDRDWEVPYPVERTFYAASNILEVLIGEKRTPFGDSLISVVVNQASDALLKGGILTTAQINELLERHKIDNTKVDSQNHKKWWKIS